MSFQQILKESDDPWEYLKEGHSREINTSAKGLEQEHDWHAKKWQGDGSEKEMKNVKYRLRDMEDRQILKNIV